MSHFLVGVVTETGSEAEIEAALAPYDENIQMPEYEEACHCCGSLIKRDIDQAADEKFGTIYGTYRASFHKSKGFIDAEGNRELIDELWEEKLRPRKEFKKRLFEASPLKNVPDPCCGFYNFDYCADNFELVGQRFEDNSGCGGTGLAMSTYNPKSEWDWWVIGGRWGDDIKTMSVSNYLIEPEIPYALVLDGEWIGRGKMGWWGMSFGDAKKADWEKTVRGLLEKVPTQIITGVDCHI